MKLTVDKSLKISRKAANDLDNIEEDPLFAVFIKSIYQNATGYPDTLKDGSEIFNDRVKRLIEDVDTDLDV